MAFEPYLFDRFMGCYKAPRVPRPEPNPACAIDKYTESFRDRWNLIRQDPCSKVQFKALNDACCALDSCVKTCENLCINPGLWANGQTLYSRDFRFPKSHNDVDDCCPSLCPCADELPDYSRDSKNVAYCPNQPYQPPYPPLDSCTTYSCYFPPHAVKPRWKRPYEQYDPCECPMEDCTITRSDFTRKQPIPNGPANSEVIKHGLWSCNQFCKDFTDETTTNTEYGPKCACRPPAILPVHNIITPCYPLKSDTETGSEFIYKEGEPVHCFHSWLDNENWHKPETPLEECTTYKHFHKAHPVPPPMTKCTVESPPAIPFCSINRLCYSCYDPVPNQKTPVEMKDNDPWPYVKPCPIRYQNNLQLDPCAKFRDETTQKVDYTPKALCRPRYSFAPIKGYVPAITPFNDDTTMKISYPAYSQEQYQYSKTYAGNPCGIRWGLNECPQRKNKCLPRFPSPFGSPLKPFNCQHGRCPCGPFDDRSTYNQAFIFRSKDEQDALESERCLKVNVPKGVSLYGFDFVPQGGKKAEKMPPPISKGYRCMQPTSIHVLDSLYRLSYTDFWQNYKKEEVEMHRGKPTIRTRRQDDCKKDDGCCQDNGDEEPVLYQPILIKVPKKKRGNLCPRPCQPPASDCKKGDALGGGDEIIRRCRPIPYSGQNILNHAKSAFICDGHDGQ